MLMIELPFPPSVNHAWKHRVIGRTVGTYLSKEALKFRSDVKRLVGHVIATDRRVSVTLTLYAPNNRKFDIDNRVKAVLDSFTHAGVWLDDEQVDYLTVIRGPVCKNNGSVFAHVELIENN
jgi:crossover junction endodeoxyribonuclease RusA